MKSLAEEVDFSGVFETHGGCGNAEFLGDVDGHVADGADGMSSAAGTDAAVVFGQETGRNKESSPARTVALGARVLPETAEEGRFASFFWAT